MLCHIANCPLAAAGYGVLLRPCLCEERNSVKGQGQFKREFTWPSRQTFRRKIGGDSVEEGVSSTVWAELWTHKHPLNEYLSSGWHQVDGVKWAFPSLIRVIPTKSQEGVSKPQYKGERRWSLLKTYTFCEGPGEIPGRLVCILAINNLSWASRTFDTECHSPIRRHSYEIQRRLPSVISCLTPV